MILVLLVLLLVVGIMTLLNGRFQLTRNKIVTGGPAYAIGVLLVMPLPLFVMAIVVVVATLLALGRTETDLQQDVQELSGVLNALQLAIDCGVVVPALLIAIWKGEPESSEPEA